MTTRHLTFHEAVRSSTEAAATAQAARDEAADPQCIPHFRPMFLAAAAFWAAVDDAQHGRRWWGPPRPVTEHDGRRLAGQLGSQFGAFG